MNRLSVRQRYIIAPLIAINVVVISSLTLFLLRSPSGSGDERNRSGLYPERSEACREAVSDALLEAGHSGLVNIQSDGDVLIALERNLFTGDARLYADGATWAALEAVADGRLCLGMNTVTVRVMLSPSSESSALSTSNCEGTLKEDTPTSPDCSPLQAVARANLSDIMLWSLGEIDDAELALRVDYHPPATTAPNAGNSITLP
jgi:hypothetical protein